MNPKTAVSGKYKELMGLAVAAQVPCDYCTFAHTEFAKLNGATDAEIAEAVMIASMARHWSTYFNGMMLDEAKFRADIAKILENTKKAMASGAKPPAPIDVVDAATAYKDIEQSFGFVPEFVKVFPEGAIAGAWRELRDVELNPNTAIPPKFKSLISLSVASQIPCRYCVIADTEFAKLDGATDAEIKEAIAMAALTRHWSTMLNGRQVDNATFKKEIVKIVANVKKSMKAEHASK
jgi:AhpD family alkylhydroperoxidase